MMLRLFFFFFVWLMTPAVTLAMATMEQPVHESIAPERVFRNVENPDRVAVQRPARGLVEYYTLGPPEGISPAAVTDTQFCDTANRIGTLPVNRSWIPSFVWGEPIWSFECVEPGEGEWLRTEYEIVAGVPRINLRAGLVVVGTIILGAFLVLTASHRPLLIAVNFGGPLAGALGLWAELPPIGLSTLTFLGCLFSVMWWLPRESRAGQIAALVYASSVYIFLQLLFYGPELPSFGVALTWLVVPGTITFLLLVFWSVTRNWVKELAAEAS